MSTKKGSKENRRMGHEGEDRLKHEFRQRFSKASDEELLRYAASCAKKLGISPSYADMVGADIVQKRFGRWDDMLDLIGLPPASADDRRYCPALFGRLVDDMARVQGQTQRVMHQNEKAFAEQHQNDTDEELFEYVRLWHKRLKRIPNHFEVLGGEYIKKRFKNDWHRVLHLAGLRGRPDNPPKFYRQLVYLDELKRQMDKYIEEYMNEIAEVMANGDLIYEPQSEKAVV